MTSVDIEVDFKGTSYVVGIDASDCGYLSFENDVMAELEQAIYDAPPESFDEECIPKDLKGFDTWRVLSASEAPPQLVGKGTKQRLQDIETVFEACAELDADEFEVYVLWCDENNHVFSVDEYKERYYGAFDNEGDYAEDLLNEFIDLRKPEYDMVRNYIDYEGMERDMALNGDIDVIKQGGTRHIFRTY